MTFAFFSLIAGAVIGWHLHGIDEQHRRQTEEANREWIFAVRRVQRQMMEKN